MQEKLNNPNNNSETSNPSHHFPSDAELRAFEEERDRWGTRFGQLSEQEPIESFARDPQNPTADELKAMGEYNAMMAGEPMTFELWFGYPDPREQPNDAAQLHQTEVSESEDSK